MCGEYGKGLYIYYGNGNGSISGNRVRLTDADGNQIFGKDRFTGPAIADIDGDGLKDLLVACSVDTFYVNGYDWPGPLKFYKNIGSEGAPSYKFQEILKDKNGEEIRQVYLRVQVADMDNDGLLDIVTANTRNRNIPGDTSNVIMYRNIGTTTEPVFDEGVILTLENGDKIPTTYAIRLGVSDFDNDGIQDLIINTGIHYPGKASIHCGVLKETANGEMKYSVKKTAINVTYNGSVIKLDGMKCVKVFDASGKKVAEKRSGELFNNIDLENLNISPGFHVLEIEHGNQINTTKYMKSK